MVKEKLTREEKERQRQKKRQEYVNNILGEPGQSLIAMKDEDQKKKLLVEEERLARYVAEESNSTAVIGDCSKLMDEVLELLNKPSIDVNTVIGKYDKIKQRLLQAYDSRETRQGVFSIVVIYNCLFLVTYAFLIIWYKLVPGQPILQSTAWVCLACTLWGGVGGVVDAFFAMHSHFSNQDFDEHFWPWYYLHPMLGLSMGAVVFLILQAGLLTISKTTLEETATTTAGVTALPIVLAFLAGFRQSTTQEFLTRIIKSIFQKEGTSK
jgi:hypothetical protein